MQRRTQLLPYTVARLSQMQFCYRAIKLNDAYSTKLKAMQLCRKATYLRRCLQCRTQGCALLLQRNLPQMVCTAANSGLEAQKLALRADSLGSLPTLQSHKASASTGACCTSKKARVAKAYLEGKLLEQQRL